MAIRKLSILFYLLIISLLLVSCTEEQSPTSIEEELNKISGSIYNESGIGENGAVVQLKVANYNPIFGTALNYDKINCRGLSEDPEILEFETTTDKDGNYCFTGVPAGTYVLTAKDVSNKKAFYKPNIKITDKDSKIGNDTLKGYVEITIHVPDSYVSENSFFYIPGTDIYFHISKAGTMYIQVPVGLISLVFCEDTELFLETLFLIIKNLLVNDTIVPDTHSIYSVEFMTPDTMNQYTTKDTIMFYVRAHSSFDHPLQYRIMWGDSVWSDWMYESKNIAQNFPYPGEYVLYAQARCALDTNVVSDWSNPLYISITDSISQEDWIKAPEFLYVTHFTNVGEMARYSAAYASSNVTTEFEYQFEWGDGTYSAWLSDSLINNFNDSLNNDSIWWDTAINGVEEYHIFTREGQYKARVRARSAFDSTLVSDWSWYSVLINVKGDISGKLPAPYVGGPNEIFVNENAEFQFAAGGPMSDTTKYTCIVEWGDGNIYEWTVIINDSMTYIIPHAYSMKGYYVIKARLYDPNDSTVYSDWSDSLIVKVNDSLGGILPRPNVPTGDSIFYVGQWGKFAIDGYVTPPNDSLQFRFDWGDSTLSNWEYVWGEHVWYAPGYYSVKCQARSALDTNNVSEWSYPLWVEVIDTLVDDTIIGDTTVIDTIIIIDTVVIIDTVYIEDTIIVGGDTTVTIDTVFTDTSFIDTSYLLK